MAHRCPHCAFNLEADEVIERDGFQLDPRGLVRFRGVRLSLSPQQCQMLHVVAAEGDRPIRRDTLFSTVSSSESVHRNHLAWDAIRNLKERLAWHGVPFPIETIGRASGLLIWNVPEPLETTE